MNRILYILLSVISVLSIKAQNYPLTSHPSPLTSDYTYAKHYDPWLTSPNAAGLTR